jgi:hypothetical protein
VFGIQDGLISTVGLLSGISAATDSRRLVVLTGLAAAVTGGISMAAGSYLSSRTEQQLFEKELGDQERLASEEPYLAQEALLESLTSEGLDRPSAYRVVQTLAGRQDLLLRTVQEKVLGLGSAELAHPVKAGLVMFFSFVGGQRGPAAALSFWSRALGPARVVGAVRRRPARRRHLQGRADAAAARALRIGVRRRRVGRGPAGLGLRHGLRDVRSRGLTSSRLDNVCISLDARMPRLADHCRNGFIINNL